MNIMPLTLFLIQVYKLPTDRFYATYFGGDEQLGLPPDDEARDIWCKFLPHGRVLPFDCKVCFHSTSIFLVNFMQHGIP